MIKLPGISSEDGFRNYIINASGQLMVFDSFGKGNNSASTGSRTYYFFPLKEKPSIEKNPISGNVVVRSASGHAIQVDSKGKIVGMTGAKYVEDSTISGKNQGGLEINYLDGIMLDCGWAIGKSACENRSKSSTFRDRAGTTCSVPNSKIFARAQGEISLAFKNNREIEAFLKKACPRLDLSPFSPQAARQSIGSHADSGSGVAQ